VPVRGVQAAQSGGVIVRNQVRTTINLLPAERERIRQAAEREGTNPHAWMKAQIIGALDKGKKESKP